ncbi:MAG: hypothetical protein JNK82_45800 [Myxococcaceae bacterium]|nr:hypothetical protein [Myxococcaceae bacterium]
MLETRLKALGQLKGRAAKKKPRTLLKLCDAGRLRGGLSVALDVTPDEVFSPLIHAMELAGLRLLDVRVGLEPGATRLDVRLHDGSVEKWEVLGVEGLVHNLNDLCRLQPEACPCAVLGEWEDMLQLWCAPRDVLAAGAAERWLTARNLAAVLAAPAGFD